MNRSDKTPLEGPELEVDDLTVDARAKRTGRPKATKDPYSLARAIVLRRLTFSQRSREELRRSLSDRDVTVDVQEEVLNRFSELGLIDDMALATSFVANNTNAGRGRRSIAYKLRARGISDDLIETALGSVTEEDELLQARVLVERRWARMAQLERAVRFRRLSGMLGRRGYAGHIVSAAIREVEEEERVEKEEREYEEEQREVEEKEVYESPPNVDFGA